MKILVINSGSSSIKYQLLDMDTERVLSTGLVERIGEDCGVLISKAYPGTEEERLTRLESNIRNHSSGMKMVIKLLIDQENGVLKDTSEIDAVGHRVVHGGERFQQPALITDEVSKAIAANVPLAPLHNPANLDGIRVATELFPGVLQVAVFDTAFHQTIPQHAFLYALPYELYEKDRIRRYGFHGTSHKFVAGECARLLAKPLEECNLITIHLGNGCSMTAVKNGCSVETSLGMTPLEGLVMGTRCGDVDPALHAILHRNKNMAIEDIDFMLNRQSGLKGVCGMNDMRDIHLAREKGDRKAQLAFDMFVYRIKKYIGSYFAVLGRVDAIVFTAGIGENDNEVRESVLSGLEGFGIVLDKAANSRHPDDWMRISNPESRVEVLVVRTNEELEIARQTIHVLSQVSVVTEKSLGAAMQRSCVAL
ncbi:MAG: acetate kinase [Proteobacteria bacterium]|nr:acetate kinase [Pseudomonadota bacterium]MBU1234227.1 acetate kinase [Pseudomonadota bacterium]MBU1418219.1 acetate kinase [Pseudomonadota bacterium]